MLLHRACGQKVVLDLSNCLKFVSSFGIGQAGLRVSMVSMVKMSTTGRAKFACQTCNAEVPNTEIDVMCQQCGKIVPANEAFIPNESGGVYCGSCAKAFYGSLITPINVSSFVIAKEALR